MTRDQKSPATRGLKVRSWAARIRGSKRKNRSTGQARFSCPAEFGFQKQPDKQGQKEDLDDPAEARPGAAG